jgi:hypothetical protein
VVPQRFLRNVGLIGLIGLLVASGLATWSDQQPSNGPLRLRIWPDGLGSLEVGAVVQLRMFASDGTREREVSPDRVSWSAYPEDVVHISAGRVVALRLGAAVLTADVEDERASVPVKVLEAPRRGIRDDLSGSWVGTYSVTSCRRVVGKGQTLCRFIDTAHFPVSLIVSQQGSSLSMDARLDCAKGVLKGFRNLGGETYIRGRMVCDGATRTEVTIVDWNVQFRYPERAAVGDAAIVQEDPSTGALYLIRLVFERLTRGSFSPGP